MNPEFKTYLLKSTVSTDCKEVETIQSLWSGYGKIARYQLQGGNRETVVVKHIALDKTNSHPRGWNTDISHQRKIRSYEVETYWYQHWNNQCGNAARTADFLGALSIGEEQWIILEDLDLAFPERKREVTQSEIKTCLSWLANFHATFLNKNPEGLWPIGTYWHLDTRPDEWEKIENSELKSRAREIDEMLNSCKHQTIVHGDAKLANFCFSANGKKVAAVDFQYVGGGCGMKNVAYFLGSCLDSAELETNADQLLDYYFRELETVIQETDSEASFHELEQEWRRLYPVAWTDFTRFMLGWMPTHQKVNEYSLKLMNSVLESMQ